MKWQLLPGKSPPGIEQSVAPEKGAPGAPPAQPDMGLSPVLVMVTVWVGLVLLIDTGPKSSQRGVTVLVGATPVPCKSILNEPKLS